MTAKGFTLVEILMVIALLGVMLVAGMPSFQAFITKTRISGATNEFLGDLSYARSEAATRQVEVAICTSADQATCASGGNWANGRIIFVDTNADGAVSVGETVLRVSQPMTGTTVTVSGFGATDILRFRPFGGLRPATAGSFRLCPPAPAAGGEGRQLAVATTGRPLISKVTTCP
ncbi:MAG TPA: GspH/FimT family pseudopilin [Burkholderiales bacterium]|nr:GspH/FimT family pseudopilin [Burkholderiales bacterium]